MNYKAALLMGALMPVFSVMAEGDRVVPRSEQINASYLSTLLLLNPCLDIRTLDIGVDDSVQKDSDEARRLLPPGTCDDPALTEKLFQARFLQHASFIKVLDPWNLDKKIGMQNQAIGRCKDAACTAHELAAVITALSAVYQGDDATWPSGQGLCQTPPAEMPTAKALALLGSRSHKAIRKGCGEGAARAQTCQGTQGTLLFVNCAMDVQSSQVNAPAWLYRLGKQRPEQMLAIDDGPFGAMQSTCNGMPDLLTSARVSMGELQKTFYRYDGKRYQAAYAYTQLSVGTDDNGNDLAIADGGTVREAVCH